MIALAIALALASIPTVLAQNCPVFTSNITAPNVLAGYNVQLVANNIRSARGIAFDTAGRLLVVSQYVGILALTFSTDQSCHTAVSRAMIVNDTSLNHGIAVSADGATLYASNPDVVYAYPYNAATGVVGPNITIVNNMSNSDHVTRTLLLSKKAPGTLIVARGSTSNIDDEASDITSGHSQIKSFNLLNRTGVYDFSNDGHLLGWGLRNDVGVDEEPVGGGIYSVENSADDVSRLGVDVHTNNPAEELNYLGTLNNNTSPNQGRNFGYPTCFSAWNVTELPQSSNITVGSQFSIGMPSATVNDNNCKNNYVAPRLVFQAHMAPLDIKFNPAGTEAWITFHGSWNRVPPVGYKVSAVKFANGGPVDAPTSLTSLTDIVTNTNLTACPGGCIRPVGLAWDSRSQLYFSSDATGEIYVITSTGNNNTAGSTPGSAVVSASSGVVSATSAATRTVTSVASSVTGAVVTAASSSPAAASSSPAMNTSGATTVVVSSSKIGLVVLAVTCLLY